MADTQSSPSLFEGINARYYRAPEVARNFVPNEQFEQLVVRQHSLVVGPRGSGKTTLLRMLHAECLEIWDHPEADRCRSAIGFSGIYVPTDRVWRKQLDALARNLPHGFESQTLFFAVVTNDILRAFVRTLQLRTSDNPRRFRPINANGRAIANLVEELSACWKVTPAFLDLASLKLALRQRRIDIRVQVENRVGVVEPAEFPEWMRLPWDDLLLMGIESVEARLDLREECWALLFDEAEIAPESVRDTILASTRGLDPRILIKCSLSPYVHGTSLWLDHDQGSPMNDFNVIRLSYGHRTESYRFSRKIIASRLGAPGLGTPYDTDRIEDVVFGRSRFLGEGEDRTGSRTSSAYGADDPLGAAIKDLAAIDIHFRRWLEQKGLDPRRLDHVTEKRRAETLRKARNIMIARLEFRRQAGFLRSRKTLAMYSGGTTMLDICEGNPRLLLGILGPLLEFFDGVHPVPDTIQAEVLERVATDFLALIDAIPVPELSRRPPELGGGVVSRSPYRELIDKVSAFLRESILKGDFDPQPPTTFRVPKACSEPLKELVGRLLNVGAFVLIPDRGPKDVVVRDFDQQRMRLCYLIAAREHLPPNVDRPKSLLKILSPDVSDAAFLPGIESHE